MTFVQPVSNSDTTGATSTTIGGTFGANNAAGNLLHLGVSWEGTTATVSVTDTAGNTWTAVDATPSRDSTNLQSFQRFHVVNCKASSTPPTVTVTASAAVSFRFMAGGEWSGIATTSPLDQAPPPVRPSATTGTDNLTSGSVTTTTNGQTIIAIAMEDGNGTTTPNPGTGFTGRVVGQGKSMTVEDQIQATAGAVAGTFTMSGSTPSAWASVATYKAAAGGPAATTASPTGIASAQAFGAVAVALTLTGSPTGIGSAETFGTPSVTKVLTASPSGIGSGETFGVLTIVSAGSVAPAGIPSAEAFGTPTLIFAQTATPTGIASAGGLGTPTVHATLTAAPSGIASGSGLGLPTIVVSLRSSPTGIPSAEQFGAVAIVSALPANEFLASSGVWGALTEYTAVHGVWKPVLLLHVW